MPPALSNTLITLDPDICNGRPTIRGKRIAVHTVLEFLSAGDSEDDILAQYPSLVRDDIRACLQFCAGTAPTTFGQSSIFRE